MSQNAIYNGTDRRDNAPALNGATSTCNICLQIKPIEEFALAPQGGHRHVCRSCMSKRISQGRKAQLAAKRERETRTPTTIHAGWEVRTAPETLPAPREFTPTEQAVITHVSETVLQSAVPAEEEQQQQQQAQETLTTTFGADTITLDDFASLHEFPSIFVCSSFALFVAEPHDNTQPQAYFLTPSGNGPRGHVVPFELVRWAASLICHGDANPAGFMFF